MWWDPATPSIAAEGDDAGIGRLAVGELEAVPGLVVDGIHERQAYEAGCARRRRMSHLRAFQREP